MIDKIELPRIVPKMPELQANVLNIHGIAPTELPPPDALWRTYADFMLNGAVGLRLESTGTKSRGRFSEQDADFVQWFERQANPVWANITAKNNPHGILPTTSATYIRTMEPKFPHQGFYTRHEVVPRRFVRLEGSASFPRYDSEYKTPIFVARLALNGGRNQYYSRIGANVAQMVQAVRVSKSQYYRDMDIVSRLGSL